MCRVQEPADSGLTTFASEFTKYHLLILPIQNEDCLLCWRFRVSGHGTKGTAENPSQNVHIF